MLVGASSVGFAVLAAQDVFGPPITIPARDIAARVAILAVGLGSLVAFGGLLGGAIAVPMWTHRSYRNLLRLGGRGHLSPALAAASWFIPVANLVVTWVALRDIWLGSAAAPRGRWLVGAWWTAWLATAAAWLAGLVSPHWIAIAQPLFDALLAVAGGLLVVIVVVVTRRQDERASRGL